MTNATLAMLDQTELFQLGLNASTSGDSGSAIAYLKEATARADASALAHYLLGAEYAQIKLYERAIDAMEAAIALDPALAIARLQLAMLWLGANDNARATVTLAPLQELAPHDPLQRFGSGLLHLVRGELAEAQRCLGEGVALNTANPALNGDMQRVMREIETLQSGAAAPAAPAVASQPDGGQHILLSAYTGNDRH